jgi:16S rRNA (guanine(966)-N(2))-methyltransferase RsmD
MRVIAGEYRRRTLVAPRGMATRPTSDRLRETLFNVLAPRLAGASFLDRGAARVVFVEQAPPAVAAIRANLTSLKITSGFLIEPRSAASWLRAPAAKSVAPFDVIFLDPPYDQAEEYMSTLGALGGVAQSLLAPGGVVVAEHRRARRGSTPEPPLDSHGRLDRTRLLEQGDAALSFYALALPAEQ